VRSLHSASNSFRLFSTYVKRLVVVFAFVSSIIRVANGQTLTTLHIFVGTDGSAPGGILAQGTNGDIYGITTAGGAHPNWGTVYEISPSGTFTSLWSFTGGVDGGAPAGGIIRETDGNLYGTTQSGGGDSNCLGCGTVFRITSSNIFTNLHSFGSLDGAAWPSAPLAQGSDGYLYGTTWKGGNTNLNGGTGLGVVFRMSTDGSFTNLHVFTGNDGFNPNGPLVQSTDGNFYGTTEYGGYLNLNTDLGYGTVFRISPTGDFTNLLLFTGGASDGGVPISGLTRGVDGNFYGTTTSGGTGNQGTAFRITPSGTLTTLCSQPSCTDGTLPSGLTQGSDGNFYGTTLNGSLFRITPDGTLTNLYPVGGPFFHHGLFMQGADGCFYGVTYESTTTNGTVSRIYIPLNPPANQISEIRLSGSNIFLSVPSVTYESYQLQFSSSLNPANWSNISGAFVSNSAGALMIVTNLGGALQSQGFYQFHITP
jgi:uncharacterized repeat protein (TIGR03803 family)